MAPSALPKAVTEAQTAGKTILELTGDDDQKYYFEKPGSKDIERFIATATKGKATQAVRNLVIEKAISPTGEELANEFKENPGRMVALNSALQAAVGMNEDFTAKKL
ncbi:MAG: hypothetical protein A2Y38_21415 [Spirochaetes bacterium GWB1_59_5]|nr:MAG: hypothetical protein A2Y38_21415 [Spirochaetes bacterium GWB1_59_5]